MRCAGRRAAHQVHPRLAGSAGDGDGRRLCQGVAATSAWSTCTPPAGWATRMGMLYNAYREGTPLLVTAGQQDRRLKFEEPILVGDMVSVARPWTKWAAEVERIEDLPAAVRRAVQVALTPPTGPVFLSIPIDVQSEVAAELDLTPARPLDHRVRPAGRCARAGGGGAGRGEEPGHPGRQPGRRGRRERRAGPLAERLGAPVIAEPGTTHGRLPLPLGSSPLRARASPLVARGSQAAGRVRRAAGRRHGPASRSTSTTSRPAHSRAHPAGPPRRRPLADGQELSARGRPRRRAPGGLAELDALLAERLTAEQVRRGAASRGGTRRHAEAATGTPCATGRPASGRPAR